MVCESFTKPGNYNFLAEPRFLEALHHLNQISFSVSQLENGECASFQVLLHRIVTYAVEVISESHAVIYSYDEDQGIFDKNSRVSTEQISTPDLDDFPRTGGFGELAVKRRARVLSYEETIIDIKPAKKALGARSLVCFPLISGTNLYGVLYIYILDQRPFSELELLMLENFVHLAEMTLSLAKLHNEAHQEQIRKERELRRLRRAGMLISSRSSLKETLDTILQVSLEITDAVYGIFRLVDKSGKYLICQAISGEGLNQPAIEELPIDGQSIMSWVANRREPVIISDLRQEPWGKVYYPFDRELEMRSELAVPLIGASGRLEGVLNLESPVVNAFDKQNRYILQILATQAVVAIQEVRLLDALQEILLLLPRYSLTELYRSLVQHGCDLLNVPYGMIWLLEGDELVLQSAQAPTIVEEGLLTSDESQNSDTLIRLGLTGTLARRAVLTGEPVAVLVKEGDEKPEYLDMPDFVGSGSALSVPLYDESPNGRIIGVFSIHTGPSENRDFSQSAWDRKVLLILGHFAALASQLFTQQEALRVAQDQRALTETFAAIGDIAANLLHRLNNKIGTIPVRVEGIQDKCSVSLSSDSYLKRNLTEIQHSATEAMDIVRESLFHLHPIDLAPVSVAMSVRDALNSIDIPSEITVVVEGLETLPPVQAGPKRLDLVFCNLIENAIDAMSEYRETGTQIHISGSASGGLVKIVLQDDGPGIPIEAQERIFDFNYSSRVSSHPSRLGFGLWWVKSLMVRFGGSVSVESDGKKGTTFILSLPQARGRVIE